MTTRYAIYAMPAPDSALWAFGSRVIGYDAITGSMQQIVPQGFDAEEWHGLTAAPRLYGFHATLKAPFRLKDAMSEADLTQAFNGFCQSCQPVALTGLAPRLIGQTGHFVALTPESQSEALHALERAAVTEFESFRAPLNEMEIAKRQPHRLDETGRHYLKTYGYPHIFERFKLHYTLSGPLTDKASQAEQGLNALYCSIIGETQMELTHLGLFIQKGGGLFRILNHQRIGSA